MKARLVLLPLLRLAAPAASPPLAHPGVLVNGMRPPVAADGVTRKIGEIQASIKRSEEDPGTVAARALARLVFPGHPYGVPVEGTRESVARLTRDDVVKFHRERFRPDATVIAVVGAVTVDEARREILARFGSWQRPAVPLASIPSAAAAREPREEVIPRDLTQA